MDNVQADSFLHERTGIELIRIPAGPFRYGASPNDRHAVTRGERPQRVVDLPEYWIGRFPVTNRQYKAFVDALVHPAPAHWKDDMPPPGKEDHPLVYITWGDMMTFCEWAGLYLPHEQEWEKAARGSDGRRWPWGDDPPTEDHCNCKEYVGDTSPVGHYSPLGDSPYGCADMAGNVWEMTNTSSEYGRKRVLRGGAWLNYGWMTRTTHRALHAADGWSLNIGFRVAWRAAPSGS